MLKFNTKYYCVCGFSHKSKLSLGQHRSRCEIFKNYLLSISNEIVFEKYLKQGIAISRLAQEYQIDRSIIEKIIKQHKIPIRTGKESQNLNSVKQKRINTQLAKFGVENCMQNKDIYKKFKETCIKKYGVEYPMQSNEIKEKLKKIIL